MLQPPAPESLPTPDRSDDETPAPDPRAARDEGVVTGLADRERLVELILQAHDEDHAATLVTEGLDLAPGAAEALLELQLKQLTYARRAELVDELTVRTTPWGPPMTLQASFPTPTTARITIDDAEHQVRTGNRHDTQLQLVQLVTRLVARPRLRPVTVTTGSRQWIVVQPDGHATWQDDEPG
ncbi:hypothetical protein GB931_10200 [Modestobacter sp. I12A-02628]|uniref:Uncharacterized protein n=1 Tax=Goekera deserti TaxID=2497753 RepID=A0A7K3WC12_9ACTN|nr:hypothetical protein [Goekera deserti]MPQ98281.1 hypothetical protein [Goekera deserti]NDI48107.1 hypothetical protein [Goekera deserti]NEL53856.1 hypothetical protein [Goekera deserti]